MSELGAQGLSRRHAVRVRVAVSGPVLDAYGHGRRTRAERGSLAVTAPAPADTD
ncbi:hypothetical protein [Streptomyces sp. NPDC059010]|uniref:hypothetical protein n=1 Tax=Streptomyces sp. NPDC059010 TaxID=3346695 RepID=UPI00367DFE07